MVDIFINRLKINDVRHLHNIDIPLSSDRRRHLIFTGGNGCGKTSTLLAIKGFLDGIPDNRIDQIKNYESSIYLWKNRKKEIEMQISNGISDAERNSLLMESNQLNVHTSNYTNQLKPFKVVILDFNEFGYLSEYYSNSDFILAFFDAKRLKNNQAVTGINKINLPDKFALQGYVNNLFNQFIVNLKAERSFANDDNDRKTIQEIDSWFNKFEKSLQYLFNDNELKLEFDRKSYNFNILSKGKEKFDFNTLSDGYSAILTIITELIMRMEKKSSQVYDIQGVVLIDEIEAHLHIDLQKKILPFLTSFFPKIQFIVTTHSPFVLTSIKDSVIYDLEKNIRVEDLSGYSLDAVVEGYFDSDKYSEVVKTQITEYEKLALLEVKTEQQQERYLFLKKYFKELPKAFSEELDFKIKQIELATLK